MAENIQNTAAELLSKRRLQLAVAESCTGGLIGHLITNVPGSSEFFLGGVIAYANEAKVRFLHVSPEILEQHGAVSEEVVQEMARGVRRAFRADIGLSVSGIAGPGGGTPQKPVGLVWIGLSAPQVDRVERFVFSGDRLAIKEQAAQAALQQLVAYLNQLPERTGRSSQMREGMEAIEVKARFDTQGKAIPLEFSWQGRKYRVESTGRRWVDEEGQHILAMIPGGRVFELLFVPLESQWFLLRTGMDRMAV